MAFAVAGFFLLISLFVLPSFLVIPTMFVLYFNVAILSTLVGLAFAVGPRLFVKQRFLGYNLCVTLQLVISILCAFWFSLVEQRYLLILLFCYFELNSTLYFINNTSAWRLDILEKVIKYVVWIAKYV